MKKNIGLMSLVMGLVVNFYAHPQNFAFNGIELGQTYEQVLSISQKNLAENFDVSKPNTTVTNSDKALMASSFSFLKIDRISVKNTVKENARYGIGLTGVLLSEDPLIIEETSNVEYIVSQIGIKKLSYSGSNGIFRDMSMYFVVNRLAVMIITYSNNSSTAQNMVALQENIKQKYNNPRKVSGSGEILTDASKNVVRYSVANGILQKIYGISGAASWLSFEYYENKSGDLIYFPQNDNIVMLFFSKAVLLEVRSNLEKPKKDLAAKIIEGYQNEYKNYLGNLDSFYEEVAVLSNLNHISDFKDTYANKLFGYSNFQLKDFSSDSKIQNVIKYYERSYGKLDNSLFNILFGFYDNCYHLSPKTEFVYKSIYVLADPASSIVEAVYIPFSQQQKEISKYIAEVLDKDREKNMMNGVIKKLGFDPEKPLMILTYGTTYGKQIGNSYIWTTNRLPLIDLLTKSEKWEFLFLMDDTGAATGSSSLTYKVYEKNNN